MILLSQTDRHPKVSKNDKVGVMSQILHLSPANTSGFEVCKHRSPGCTAACLHYSGFQYQKKYDCRIRRTEWFFKDRPAFMRRLAREIDNLQKRAQAEAMIPGIRLNGTSDIPWERVRYPGTDLCIMEMFPDVQFMDYTKYWDRTALPDNYQLIFSRSECNDNECLKALDNGFNLAVVFADKLPSTFKIGHWELPVYDGDEHDRRYLEYENYAHRLVVGLKAKGAKGKGDTSGFVVR